MTVTVFTATVLTRSRRIKNLNLIQLFIIILADLQIRDRPGDKWGSPPITVREGW